MAQSNISMCLHQLDEKSQMLLSHMAIFWRKSRMVTKKKHALLVFLTILYMLILILFLYDCHSPNNLINVVEEPVQKKKKKKEYDLILIYSKSFMMMKSLPTKNESQSQEIDRSKHKPKKKKKISKTIWNHDLGALII